MPSSKSRWSTLFSTGLRPSGLKWHALPALSGMRLEIGGVNYTAAPFNGWYMGTEIGARDFADASRYNVLPVIAEKMGLDTRSERSLWIDRALLGDECGGHSLVRRGQGQPGRPPHGRAALHEAHRAGAEGPSSGHRAVELARPTHVGFNHAGLSSGIQEHHRQAQFLLSGRGMGVFTGGLRLSSVFLRVPDLLGSARHRLSLIDTTGLAEQDRVVIQDFSDLRMVSGQALLPEGQGSLKSGLRLGVSALPSADGRQDIKIPSDFSRLDSLG